MHPYQVPLLAVAAATLLAGCGGSATTVAPAVAAKPANQQASPQSAPTTAPVPVATNSVSIQNFDFSPVAVTVPAGTTVTWTNKDIEQHTVTARYKAFNSDALNNGTSFSWTFSTPGSYEYFCLIHPHMVGAVVVTDK